MGTDEFSDSAAYANLAVAIPHRSNKLNAAVLALYCLEQQSVAEAI